MIYIDLLRNLLSVTVISLFFYLIGLTFLQISNFKNHTQFRVFISSIVGFLIVILFTSLCITKFKTINILLLLVGFYLTKYLRFEFKVPIIDLLKKMKTDIPIILIYTTIFFLYQSFYYYDFYNNDFKPLFKDNYLYSYAVDSLTLFKIENYDIDQVYINSTNSKLMPYRYFEYYLGYLAVLFFKINSISSYFLISIPLFLAQFATGLHGYFINFKGSNFFKIGIIFILMFISSLFLPYLNEIKLLKYISEQSFMGVFNQKLCFIGSIFLLASFIYKKNNLFAYLILIIIPILHPIYLPSTYGALIILFIYNLLKNFIQKDSFLIKEHLKLILLIFTITFLFFQFYELFGINYQIKYNTPPILRRLSVDPRIGILQKVKEFIFIKLPDGIKYIYYSTSNLLVGTLFYIPLFLFVLKSYLNSVHYKNILKFSFLMLFIGLSGVVIKDGEFDNFQLYTAVLILLPIILQQLFLDSLLNNNSKFSILTSIFILCVVFFNLLPIIQLKFKLINPKMSYKQSFKSIPTKKVLKIAYFVDLDKIEKSSLFYLKTKHNRILTEHNPVFTLRQYSSNTIISLPLVKDTLLKVNENVGVLRFPSCLTQLNQFDLIVMSKFDDFNEVFENKIKYRKVKVINKYKFYYLIN